MNPSEVLELEKFLFGPIIDTTNLYLESIEELRTSDDNSKVSIKRIYKDLDSSEVDYWILSKSTSDDQIAVDKDIAIKDIVNKIFDVYIVGPDVTASPEFRNHFHKTCSILLLSKAIKYGIEFAIGGSA